MDIGTRTFPKPMLANRSETDVCQVQRSTDHQLWLPLSDREVVGAAYNREGHGAETRCRTAVWLNTKLEMTCIWQCDAGHTDITWDTVISLFDPVLDSMPCSFFKRDIQSTALQARGRVCRVRGTQHWMLLSGYGTRIHDAVCSQGSVFFKISKTSTAHKE